MDFGISPKATRRQASLRGESTGAGKVSTEPQLQNETSSLGSSVHAYVTRSTFNRLAGQNIELITSPPSAAVFSAIFHRSLVEILSTAEALRVYSIKLMVEHQFAMVRVARKYSSRKYVFKVAPPKFHRSETCEYLQSDFFNYQVPPEIKALGEDKIKEFQEFCDANKALLRDGDSEKFWLHAGAHFRVKIQNIVEIHYANSGVQELGALTVEELRKRIEELLDEATAILEDRSVGSKIRDVRYAPTKRKAISCLRDPGAKAPVERLFDLKRQIFDALLEMYMKQAGAKGFVLPEEILSQAGLEPCRGCKISDPVIFD